MASAALALTGCFLASSAAPPPGGLSVDWASFLGRSDPTWTQPPTEWYDSAFVGNGKLGAMVRVAEDGTTLKVDVGSSAVWDDRMPGEPFSAVPDNMECNRPRLPLGSLELSDFSVLNTTDSFRMKIGLHDAEVAGAADDVDAAYGGRIAWRVFAHAVYAEADVLAVELTHTTNRGPAASTTMPSWRFLPADANRPWASRACLRAGDNFTKNPPCLNATAAPGPGNATAQLFTQRHLSGKEHSTAVLAIPGTPYSSQTATATATATTTTTRTDVLYVSTSSVLPAGEGDAAALGAVRAAASAGLAALTASHRAWWHAYYPTGAFVTLAAPTVEAFYWIQMYKIASATRADRELFDLMGPWGVQPTSWPDVHWDLNLQMAHWVFFGANRVDLARSLTSRLAANTPTLINNVPPAWRADSAAAPSDSSSPLMLQSCGAIGGLAYNGTCLTAAGAKPTATGNLLWAMQQWHNVYRYNGFDRTELAALFPLLARAVTYYTHITHLEEEEKEEEEEEEEEGGGGPGGGGGGGAGAATLHINATVSPEYGAPTDANYDISLLKWGLAAVLDAAAKGLPAALHHPSLATWQRMNATLVGYQTDAATGFLIGRGMPLAHGHRHFSHLMMLFPLKQLDLDGDPAAVALAERSLDHWLGAGDLHGFSFAAASPMNVMLGRREGAFANISHLFEAYITPNTMYYEGKAYPCGETPPAAASAIMDWLVMEWGGVVRVFAGVDDAAVRDAAFDRLLAPGGFELTGRRAGGVTDFVAVTNAHGVAPTDMATLALQVDAMPLPWGATPSTVRWTPRAAVGGQSRRSGGDAVVIVDIDLATLPKGATVTFYSAAAKPASFAIVPSEGGSAAEYNFWGFPKGAPPTPTPPPAPAAHKCFAGTVCGAKFSGDTLGCCPYEDAVCCPNQMTCCPRGSTCADVGWNGNCTGAPEALRVAQPVCKAGAPLPFSKTLPNVLVIGDSVSIGYTPKIAAHMAAVALVQHSPWDLRDGGAEETAYGVACLPYLLRSPGGELLEPDVVMFNWGLHDGPLKNVTQPGQYGLPAVYAAQLENITVQLKRAQPRAKLVFAGTTAFMCNASQDGCVVNLNNQAAAIMARHGIPMLNLHDGITGQCGPAPNGTCFGAPKCFCPHCSPDDGVGYEFLAAHLLAPALTALLPGAGPTPPPGPTPPEPTPTPPTPPTPMPPTPPAHSCASFGAAPPTNYDCKAGYCIGSSTSCGATIAEPLLDLSGGCSFVEPTTASMAACAKAAAAACDASTACRSFALDPSWHATTPKAKLFASPAQTTPNAAWVSWVKKAP